VVCIAALVRYRIGVESDGQSESVPTSLTSWIQLGRALKVSRSVMSNTITTP
jgi:hypothetical protein